MDPGPTPQPSKHIQKIIKWLFGNDLWLPSELLQVTLETGNERHQILQKAKQILEQSPPLPTEIWKALRVFIAVASGVRFSLKRQPPFFRNSTHFSKIEKSNEKNARREMIVKLDGHLGTMCWGGVSMTSPKTKPSPNDTQVTSRSKKQVPSLDQREVNVK